MTNAHVETVEAKAQQGISPKALVPTLIGLVVGIVLLVVALLSHDETLKTVAVSVLLSCAGFGGLAFAAKPGVVKIVKRHL